MSVSACTNAALQSRCCGIIKSTNSVRSTYAKMSHINQIMHSRRLSPSLPGSPSAGIDPGPASRDAGACLHLSADPKFSLRMTTVASHRSVYYAPRLRTLSPFQHESTLRIQHLDRLLKTTGQLAETWAPRVARGTVMLNICLQVRTEFRAVRVY